MSLVRSTAAALADVAFLGLYGRRKRGIPINVLMVFVSLPDTLR